MRKIDLAAPSQYTDFLNCYITGQIVLHFICRPVPVMQFKHSFYAHVAKKVITELFNNKMYDFGTILQWPCELNTLRFKNKDAIKTNTSTQICSQTQAATQTT